MSTFSDTFFFFFLFFQKKNRINKEVSEKTEHAERPFHCNFGFFKPLHQNGYLIHYLKQDRL